MVNNSFEKIREVWISNGFLQLTYQISIKLRIKNTLLQKFIQTDMIFFYQFKVSMIKVVKTYMYMKANEQTNDG